MTDIELQELELQAKKLSGLSQRSCDLILAALIRAKATEKAGVAISGSLDRVAAAGNKIAQEIRSRPYGG